MNIGLNISLTSLWNCARYLTKRPILLVNSVILIALFVLVIAGPQLTPPHDPLATDLALRLLPPSIEYPMGCDDALGRCMLSRIICGARSSIGIGILAVALSSCIGMFIGLAAGFFGGLIDEVFMRLTDIFLAFPEMIAAMALAGIMGPGNNPDIAGNALRKSSPSFTGILFHNNYPAYCPNDPAVHDGSCHQRHS